MTLDDLRLTFNIARVDGKDGIRAVVEALRDEIFSDANDILDLRNLFNEILASDGVVKP